MKIFYVFTSLILLCFSFGCQKLQSAPVPYDVQAKIFRVLGTYQKYPYTISLEQIRPNYPIIPFNHVNFNANSDLDYQFTPDIGDTIKIVAKSDSGKFLVYAHYLNLDLGDIPVVPNGASGYTANFSYVIK